ncbi:MAG: Radical domain protein [Deltaproteobacteria bacterium]|nr:Radical domain protein [Deltaproteobacteria bacterium]
MFERKRGLIRAPKLLWDILFKGRYSFIYDQMAMRREGMSFPMRVNLLKAGINFLYRRAKPWSMPLHTQVEVTNYCNLRCPVCPTGSGALDRKPRAMPPTLFERFMNEVGQYLLTISLWAWGEPLLHPQLSEILRIANKYPVITFLSTNGQNLEDERVVKAIIDSPPTYLIVAIDGLTDATNSQYRVGAKLEPILSGVRKVREEKLRRDQKLPVLHMRFMVMKHNEHEVDHVTDFARDNGFDILTLRSLCPVNIPSGDILLEEFIADDPAYCGYDLQGDVRLHRSDFMCQHPFWFPTMLADGTIVSCSEDYNAEEPFGTCTESTSFREIWYSGNAEDVRRVIRRSTLQFSFCKSCPKRDRESTDASVMAISLKDDGPCVVVKRG